MIKLVCDSCGKRIKADTAMAVVNTATTTQRWHISCCPMVSSNRVPEADQHKGRVAA